jgi:ABC-2 type transport system ATP-binding protein
MTSETVLRVEGVSYAYRRRRRPALDQVTLALGVGVTGLLGPNGAGKTTLMRLIAGSIRPDAGSVSVGGEPARGAGRRRVRRQLGWLPQDPARIPGFSVRDYVAYAAWLRGVPDGEVAGAVARALDLVDLADSGPNRLAALSGGMFRRAAIAATIVHRPAVLLLDEPTAGLDPGQRASFRSLLATLGQQACVVMSTHLTADVESSCDDVVVLADGTIRFTGPLDGFRSLHPVSGGATASVEAAYLELVERR